MRPTRIILHGLLLLIANLTGVFAGFMAYHALSTRNQLETQLPIAIVISILLYLAWAVLFWNLPLSIFRLRGIREYVLAGVCSLVWNPVVFVPLHYITQGYFTGMGNIVALAIFQAPVNAVTLFATWKLTKPRTAQG